MGCSVVAMFPDHDEVVALGRAVVSDGRLRRLRERLGLTRSAMSELVYTNMVTYTDWERRPEITLRPATAERVGRFYETAEQQMKLLDEAGINLYDMVPFHVVATLLGIPQELLVQWYREERFSAIDAGILGLWVSNLELTRLRSHR